MTQNKKLDEIVNSYLINCRGIEYGKGGQGNVIVLSILSKENAEPVIIKIYKSGKSVPLCKYLYDNLCIEPENTNDQGKCPYCSE